MALGLQSHLFSPYTLEFVSFVWALNIFVALLCQSTAGIAFSADLTLRWVSDGFWDFFQGIDAGSLSSIGSLGMSSSGSWDTRILSNLPSTMDVGMWFLRRCKRKRCEQENRKRLRPCADQTRRKSWQWRPKPVYLLSLQSLNWLMYKSGSDDADHAAFDWDGWLRWNIFDIFVVAFAIIDVLVSSP